MSVGALGEGRSRQKEEGEERVVVGWDEIGGGGEEGGEGGGEGEG